MLGAGRVMTEAEDPARSRRPIWGSGAGPESGKATSWWIGVAAGSGEATFATGGLGDSGWGGSSIGRLAAVQAHRVARLTDLPVGRAPPPGDLEEARQEGIVARTRGGGCSRTTESARPSEAWGTWCSRANLRSRSQAPNAPRSPPAQPLCSDTPPPVNTDSGREAESWLSRQHDALGAVVDIPISARIGPLVHPTSPTQRGYPDSSVASTLGRHAASEAGDRPV